MRILHPRGTSLTLVLLLSFSRVLGETIALPASADTTLFELDPDFNFGRQPTLPAGAIGTMFPASGSERGRGLFKFDLGTVPEGAIIESAAMELSISIRIPSRRSSSDFSLHRVLVDWGEGDGFGEIPGGAEAQAGEATWNNRFHPDTPWSTPGGALGADFATDSSATAENVDGSRVSATTYRFVFNDTGVADLQQMLDGGVENYGWMLRSEREDTVRTARHWISSDPQAVPNPLDAGPLPVLEITYSLMEAPPLFFNAVEVDLQAQELQVRLDGMAGRSYQLEVSTDLITWNEEGVAQTPLEDGELVFSTPFVGTGKFVRVRASTQP